MPAWAKVLLSVLAAGILVLVVGGVIIVKVFKSQIEATERAAAEGRGFGFAEPLDRCTAEGVRRTGSCEGVACTMQLHAFMWGCLENANYDAEYCASVAPIENDAATARWTAATCAEFGQPHNDTCRFVLTVVPSFCSYMSTSGNNRAGI